MFKRMLVAAVLAGGAAGLVGALLHFIFVQDLILLAERYETGELVHSAGGSSPDDAPAHQAAPAAHTEAGHAEPAHTEAAHAEAGHDHADAGGHDHAAAGGEDSPAMRNTLTVASRMLTYVGFAMLVVVGFGMAEARGRSITAAEGLMWGIAGFVAFQLAPGMGLSPALPGTIAADITERQIWWWGAALSTAGGLALLAYLRNPVTVVVAALLLLAPHLVGAPLPEGFWGVNPPEVAAAFAARALGVGLASWAVLGWVAAWLWARPQTA